MPVLRLFWNWSQFLFMLLLVLSPLLFPVLAQNRIGEINNIEKPPSGATTYGPREVVRSVEVYRQSGQTDLGFKTISLNIGDEINVRRGDPQVYRVIVGFDDPTQKLLKLAPGSYVRLIGRDAVQSTQDGFFGWVKGKIQATTKYVQAIAPGTQYGIVADGERSRVFVWEGKVQVTNLGANRTTVLVQEKQLTDVFGPNQPGQPRVPRFEEVKDLVLFGLDFDPVIRGTVTDENLRRQLHEDLIRAQFESRVQRSAVGPQINLANVWLFLHKDEEALDAFAEAERVSPRPAAIFNGRGVALMRLGRFDDAEAAFREALARDNDSLYHNNLGNLYLSQITPASDNRILIEYEEAIKRDRTNAAPENGRGVAFLVRKEFASAGSALSRSIQLKDRAVAHSNLGNLRLFQNDLSEAEAEYAKALQFDPQEAAALNNRGVAYLKQRKYVLARADFARSIECDPREPAPRIGLGLAYVGLNQFEDAASAFFAALQPEYSGETAYRNLAYLFLTREPARSVIQHQLQAAMGDANAHGQGRLARFSEFLHSLPTVHAEEFDNTFQKFLLATR